MQGISSQKKREISSYFGFSSETGMWDWARAWWVCRDPSSSPALHPSYTCPDPGWPQQHNLKRRWIKAPPSPNYVHLIYIWVWIPWAHFCVILPLQRITYQGFLFQPCGGALFERITPSSVAKSQWHLPCLKRLYYEEWLLIPFHILDHFFVAVLDWSWWATLSNAYVSWTQQFTEN